MTAARRLLLVHAHPDDETITTGGTIARYLAEGADVTVVTCTLGEEGEVMEPRFAELTSENADQLGGYRIGELTAALAALSAPGGPVLEPLFLGGAGRWRDSGMAGTPAAEHPRAFASTPPEWGEGGPLAALTGVIRAKRPQVVITYDEVGGYGHPDHIAAHRLTTAAVAAAANPGGPGSRGTWRSCTGRCRGAARWTPASPRSTVPHCRPDGGSRPPTSCPRTPTRRSRR
ncbi:hypothetical protein MTP03_11970 [Tsukamurella sp. PLM1]|nr:hypothetical protein MTP03_11970 [Tsukamurella sp. PLM1]